MQCSIDQSKCCLAPPLSTAAEMLLRLCCRRPHTVLIHRAFTRTFSSNTTKGFPSEPTNANDGGVETVGHSLIPLHHPPFTPSPQYQLPIDTYEWVKSLSGNNSTNFLSREQAEAIIGVVQEMAAYRLGEWHSSLVALPRLHQDLHILRALTHDLSLSSSSPSGGGNSSSSSPLATLTKLENEQRSRNERLQTELHLVADQLRDLVTAVRTDLALIVNGYRAEAREDTQKMELELHKLDARLAAAAGNFKGQAEQVKLKALYTFAIVIVSTFILIIGEKTSKKRQSAVTTTTSSPSSDSL